MSQNIGIHPAHTFYEEKAICTHVMLFMPWVHLACRISFSFCTVSYCVQWNRRWYIAYDKQGPRFCTLVTRRVICAHMNNGHDRCAMHAPAFFQYTLYVTTHVHSVLLHDATAYRCTFMYVRRERCAPLLYKWWCTVFVIMSRIGHVLHTLVAHGAILGTVQYWCIILIHYVLHQCPLSCS